MLVRREKQNAYQLCSTTPARSGPCDKPPGRRSARPIASDRKPEAQLTRWLVGARKQPKMSDERWHYGAKCSCPESERGPGGRCICRRAGAGREEIMLNSRTSTGATLRRVETIRHRHLAPVLSETMPKTSPERAGSSTGNSQNRLGDMRLAILSYIGEDPHGHLAP